MHHEYHFINGVRSELGQLWPGCKIVKGALRHSESNSGIERRNRTVENRIGAMMAQCNCNHWYVQCRLVQWYENTTHRKAITDIPCRSLTGQNPQVGISSLPIDQDLLNNLFTEAALVEQFGILGDVHLYVTQCSH